MLSPPELQGFVRLVYFTILISQHNTCSFCSCNAHGPCICFFNATYDRNQYCSTKRFFLPHRLSMVHNLRTNTVPHCQKMHFTNELLWYLSCQNVLHSSVQFNIRTVNAVYFWPTSFSNCIRSLMSRFTLQQLSWLQMDIWLLGRNCHPCLKKQSQTHLNALAFYL